MSFHVMTDLQCPNNAGGIAALNSHGKSLTQERCWPWFVANFCKPASNLRDKFHGMLTPSAGWRLEWSQRSYNYYPPFHSVIIIILNVFIITMFQLSGLAGILHTEGGRVESKMTAAIPHLLLSRLVYKSAIKFHVFHTFGVTRAESDVIVT